MIQRLKHWLQRGGVHAGTAAAPARVRLLMVCTGNICRSPTAAGVLLAKLRKAGLHGAVSVDSAGTHGFHTSEPPDPRAIRHAAGRGYDIAASRARPVQDADFARHDWLLAMDGDNLQWLRRRAAALPIGATVVPGLQLLMSHALNHASLDAVPDPYYGGPAGFEHVLDLLEDACDGLVTRLASELQVHPDGAGVKLD